MDCGGKCLWRNAGQPWKQGDNAESHVGDGDGTIASLSPHTRQLNNREAGPSNVQGTELRVGTHPGCPLMFVTDAPNIREGFQARESSKYLNKQSYVERLAQEAF